MHHNDKLEGAAYVWLAAAGAGVKPRGELQTAGELGQNQVAATLARALGRDYRAAQPGAGPAVELFFQP